MAQTMARKDLSKRNAVLLEHSFFAGHHNLHIKQKFKSTTPIDRKFSSIVMKCSKAKENLLHAVAENVKKVQDDFEIGIDEFEGILCTIFGKKAQKFYLEVRTMAEPQIIKRSIKLRDMEDFHRSLSTVLNYYEKEAKGQPEEQDEFSDWSGNESDSSESNSEDSDSGSDNLVVKKQKKDEVPLLKKQKAAKGSSLAKKFPSVFTDGTSSSKKKKKK